MYLSKIALRLLGLAVILGSPFLAIMPFVGGLQSEIWIIRYTTLQTGDDLAPTVSLMDTRYNLTYHSQIVASRFNQSPDRRFVADVNRDGAYVQMIGDANTDDITITEEYDLSGRLTVGGLTAPAWSPDSEQLVFDVFVPPEVDGNANVHFYAVDRDGSNRQRIATNNSRLNNPGRVFVDWSPDGETIALTLYREGNVDVYTVRPDGSNLTRITDHPAEDVNPVWSPDGSKLAYMNYQGVAFYGLYILDVETGEIDGPWDDALALRDGENLRWSPDGSQLAYISNRDGQIYRIDVDGRNIVRLTDDDAFKVLLDERHYLDR